MFGAALLMRSVQRRRCATIGYKRLWLPLPYPLVTLNFSRKNSLDGWNFKLPVGIAVTKKRAKKPDRVYPRDLHGILQGLWDDKPSFRGWPMSSMWPYFQIGFTT